ncbi:GTP-binding protein [Patulibacter sp. SYSU D01012]|uniref:sulfate adenylyltransferase subunit 1 n=1 Tax=Patulibacter sp. SYSU D01012 TaxID=2817381 RepID=UPI001B313FC1|nr:GTP-binding protein [Patulibacter sp. SYSU D01012]
MTTATTPHAGPVAATADLLRVATAGSVDDGKSTLIGRLLYDSKQVLVDQLEQVQEASVRRHGAGAVDLSLLTDGLRAEREQGITIDVAYRYFTTGDRSFILADTPGHVQYTRNMVTGASTADLVIVLVDARQGVIEQTRRHTFIASLLGIRHVTFAVNKMDLVDWDEERFRAIEAETTRIAAQLGIPDIHVIPISALEGTNVVDRGDVPGWYPEDADHPTLLRHLQTVQVASDRNLTDVRFPVQWVIRPGGAVGRDGVRAADADLHDYRGYAGQVAGGVLRPGDEVQVLPSGVRTRIARIETFDGDLDEATAPMSVTVHLQDDVDVSRGDVLVGAGDDAAALCRREFEADVCWMSDRPLRPGQRLLLKHTTTTTVAKVDAVLDRLDLHTLDRVAPDAAGGLELNDIGRIRLRVKRPLVADPYDVDRTTGAFILVDEGTNDTVAGGMIR